MNLRSISLFLLLAFIGLCLNFSNVQAQSIDSSIAVTIAPEHPEPFENTTITLSSYGENLDGALISWFLNGTNTSSGIGKKTFILKSPGAGAVSNVVAKIVLPIGTIEKKISIKPNVMVLLWQAEDSYTPPFYKGKALASPGSGVKVIAMPEVRTSAGFVSPKNMTYAWQQDYTNIPNDSGYGKSFLVYQNDYLDQTNNISVIASTIDGQNSSSTSLDIPTKEPEMLFYRNDANLGTIWEKTLEDLYKVSGTEVVVGTPYFISPKDIRSSRLVFTWFINNSIVNLSGSRKNMIPLKAPEGTSGVSRIRLEVESRDKIFQSASGEISIEF